MNILVTSDADSIPDADLNAIKESLYLLSVPGMCESIKAGMAQPPEDLAISLDW